MLALIGVTLLAWIGWRSSHPRELVWHGKPLSAWLEICYQNYGWPSRFGTSHGNDATAQESIHAVQQIGTNAIPLLLRLVAVEDLPFKSLTDRHSPRLHSKSFQWYWKLRVRADQPTICRNKALLGFWALGATGKPAIPTLVHLLQVSKDPQCRQAAADCLGYVGPDARLALPVLVEKFKDPDWSVRKAAVRGLLLIAFDSAKQAFRPGCIEFLNPALERIRTDPSADADAIMRADIVLEMERRPLADDRPAADEITSDAFSSNGLESIPATPPLKTRYHFTRDGAVVFYR
jgi:hypothetical protein